ncbi:hypothetical protein GCM10010390_49030 [Streptomyces mordarskii]|uniref:Uncharacterized protein n=1 Tax=Streptomyces mordarskii TaxID=1226758 RepID=A0ABP3NCG5_9ACTN
MAGRIRRAVLIGIVATLAVAMAARGTVKVTVRSFPGDALVFRVSVVSDDVVAALTPSSYRIVTLITL